MGEVTIEIKESAASRPFVEVFEEDQKLWEVFKFAESHLGAGAMLWNVRSQEIYTSGSKALKKSLQDLGLTGNVTFMGVRKERIPKVPMRIRPIRRDAAGGRGAPGGSYEEESEEHAVSLEERKAKAKQYLQEKREAEKALVTEAEKEKEKERRRIGQELMREKMKKEREEMKKVSESISQRKAAKKAELAAIRAQIARDKEARKKEREGSTTAPTTTKPVTSVVRDGKVKMKIKVADSTILKTFEETDLLSTVVDYVRQETQQEVTLSNTYPRKDYRTEDLEKSLASLGLTGNISLVGKSGSVKPENVSETSTEAVPN